MFASDTEVDGIWYNFDDNTLTAEVTYYGASAYAYSGEYSGTVTIPSYVTYNTKTYSVTSIGEMAFYNCFNLTSVTIPNSVTYIEDGAFLNCDGLTSMTIPNSVTIIGGSAFEGCTGLTSIEIPNSVTYIGGTAFKDCTGLTSVTIGNGIKTLSGFEGCTSLTSVTIPNSVEWIDGSTFKHCTSLSSITIPNSVREIGEEAFAYCTSLTSIEIPSSVTYIRDYAFWYSNLTTVILNSQTIVDEESKGLFFGEGVEYVIGDGVTSIGKNAFGERSGTISVVISNSVTSIGDYAFYKCSSLTTVAIGNGVTSIGNNAFYGCSGLTSIEIPDNVTSIGMCAFMHCSGLESVTIGNSVVGIEFATFLGCTSLASVKIGNNVTYIRGEAFENCTSLLSVEIPNSVTSIGNMAFSNCSGLTSITIPNSVISIESYAFDGCTGMTSVTIGNSVTSIGENAFGSIDNLSITCYATTPPTIEEHAFDHQCYDEKCTQKYIKGTLYVLKQSLQLYKEAYEWKDFKSILAIESSEPDVYTITFLNWDGAELLTLTDVEEGTIPQYTGATPARPDDEQYTYIFSGWSPEIVAATKDATYTAEYNATPIGQSTYATEIEDAVTSATPVGENSVELVWPYVENAEVYIIEILKNNILCNKLTFNENGLLQSNVSYMPSRYGENRQTLAATKTTKGWKYTINGLESGVTYTYVVTAKKSDASVLYTKTITFSIGGSVTPESNAITVRLDPTSATPWNKVYLYAWIGSGDDATILCGYWPGTQVSKDSGGWWSYTFDESIKQMNIIWTNGNGDQTIDINNVSASTCYSLNSTTGNKITVNVVDCPQTQDIEEVSIDSFNKSDSSSRKFIKDGQIFILRGDKTYTVTGQEVK